MTSSLPKTILAIDTSCDETAAAVVEGRRILSNIVASQAQLHQKYGGVFPTVAKQAHRENIEPTVQEALSRAQKAWQDIDGIAVTQGPGLAPALEIGITYAKQMAQQHQLPLYPINHLEGHLLSVLAVPSTQSGQLPPLKTPTLSLIISGGHSEFVLVDGVGKYQRLGWTIDDAAGEALDKVGRMLDLGYPAGPVLEEFARLGNRARWEFPLPMTTSRDYNLSFSGLKTFARNLLKDLETKQQLSQQDIFDFAASFQYAIFRHICHKLNTILIDCPDLGEVWLGGGVAANTTLRVMLRQTLRKHAKLKTSHGTPTQPLALKVPYTKKLCGDNAAMIGLVASVQQLEPQTEFERQPKLALK